MPLHSLGRRLPARVDIATARWRAGQAERIYVCVKLWSAGPGDNEEERNPSTKPSADHSRIFVLISAMRR
jgi:hypothetical protein